MDDRLTSGGGGFGSHGRARYPEPLARPRRFSPAGPLWPLLLLAVLFGSGDALAGPAQLKASGVARSFEIKVAGGKALFRFKMIAGCRYRMVAEPGSLGRPHLAMGRAGEAPYMSADAGASGQPAVHVWDAQRDTLMEVTVTGFSAQTGKGKVRLETLGPDEKPVSAHRRFLWLGGKTARVGDLLVGEANLWDLAVKVGEAYVITPTRGSAGRVRLRVLGWKGEVLADSTTSGVAWLPHPAVRFRVPEREAEAPADASPKKGLKKGRRKKKPALRLEVRALLDGGGTYGLRMAPLGEGQSVEPPSVAPPPAVEAGPVEGEAQTFRAGPGDVALLYVSRSPNRTQIVQMQRGKRWIQLDDMGQGGSARSQEHALLVWFRPYHPGTYRFRGVPGPPPSKPRLGLHERAALGSAPIHMGTGSDPTVRARLKSGWTLVGLGACMPGWEYIFVCVGGPDQGIAMRVRNVEGKTIRSRSASGKTISPGLGPSMRFRVPATGIYRLEAKNGRKRIIRPLLRRASN